MDQHFTVRLPQWQRNKKMKPKDRISTNEIYRVHFGIKNRVAKAYYDAVFYAVKQYKIRPVKKYPVELHFTFCFTGRLLDSTNCSGMEKNMEDGLRHAGIIEDDRPKFVCETRTRSEKSSEKYSFCNVDIVCG